MQSLPYALDEESVGEEEYVRYPVETLADGEGDCEDKVSLLAALFKEMDVEFVLLELPDHLGFKLLRIEGDQCMQRMGKDDAVEDGYLLGGPIDEVVLENDSRFKVDWENGQKTGFFLDQRDNRERVRQVLSC